MASPACFGTFLLNLCFICVILESDKSNSSGVTSLVALKVGEILYSNVLLSVNPDVSSITLWATPGTLFLSPSENFVLFSP